MVCFKVRTTETLKKPPKLTFIDQRLKRPKPTTTTSLFFNANFCVLIDAILVTQCSKWEVQFPKHLCVCIL